MGGKRQNIQLGGPTCRGERSAATKGPNHPWRSPTARPWRNDHGASGKTGNCAVRKGGPGAHRLRQTTCGHGQASAQLLDGTYQPQPVKRVEIPKPDGGVRKLGVPCVVDRLAQQAVLQVLQAQWDPTFSAHSYGFRPGRSAHQAVAQAQAYIAEGYGIVVDIDLEKFSCQSGPIDGPRCRTGLRQTGAHDSTGVMEDGLVYPGTPRMAVRFRLSLAISAR